MKIDEKWRLPKVNGFKSVAEMLGHSWLFVFWVAVGIGIGIYDKAHKYLKEWVQFNKSLL